MSTGPLRRDRRQGDLLGRGRQRPRFAAGDAFMWWNGFMWSNVEAGGFGWSNYLDEPMAIKVWVEQE